MSDQAQYLARVQEKSRLIAIQQAKADAGQFTTYGGALGLQALRADRAVIAAKLDRPRLVHG